MKDFQYWQKCHENEQLEEFNTDVKGILWLKTKSIIRKDLILEFVNHNHIILKKNTLREQFKELFELFCDNIDSSHVLLDDYIHKKSKQQIAQLDINHLVSELYKLKNFNWGGDYRNSLDKFLVSHYVKTHQSYDSLILKLDTEINTAVQSYVLNSWYNHWSSILIEFIFKSHPLVLPTVGQIKSVDFFISCSVFSHQSIKINTEMNDDSIRRSTRSIPFDLKVTYLPAEYIKRQRKEKQLPNELTFLKEKARAANINFDKNAKPSDIYQEITERMKDKNDSFCNAVLETLKNETLQILKEAQANPKMLATWLYENQGEMRFGSENRLFLVLVDSNDFTNSWKLKRNIDLLKPTIMQYLDNFGNQKTEDLKITFNYPGKPRTFTAFTDVIFVVK